MTSFSLEARPVKAAATFVGASPGAAGKRLTATAFEYAHFNGVIADMGEISTLVFSGETNRLSQYAPIRFSTQLCETFIARAYEQFIGQCAEIIDEADSMRIPP